MAGVVVTASRNERLLLDGEQKRFFICSPNGTLR
jgi:hypothetical protein